MKHLNTVTKSVNPHFAMESMVSAVGVEGFNLMDLTNKGEDFLVQLFKAGSDTVGESLFKFKKAIANFEISWSTSPDIAKYNEVMGLKVMVPEGFSGNVNEYIDVLSNGLSLALRTQEQVLIPLQEFFDKLVGNAGFARDTRQHLKFLQSAEGELQQYATDSQKFFTGSSSSYQKFNTLYRNLSEWESSYNKIQALNDAVSSINREEIINRVELIARRVEMMRENVKTGELDSMSKQVLSEISQGIYLTARIVEHVGLVSFAIYTLANTMNETAKKI